MTGEQRRQPRLLSRGSIVGRGKRLVVDCVRSSPSTIALNRFVESAACSGPGNLAADYRPERPDRRVYGSFVGHPLSLRFW